MTSLSKEEILASSKGWVAALLNFLPGLGSGYLYQRRWIPYFLTLLAVTTFFAIAIIIQDNKEPTLNEQLIGIAGLSLISIFTVIESILAYKKAFDKVIIKQEEIKASDKKGWF